MRRFDHQLIQILIEEEIARIVSEAVRDSGMVRAGEHAYRLLRQFPSSGMTIEDVVNAIIDAASKAGVAVEIGQPEAVAA